ncbi:MAG: Hsp70 family protein [Tessaracoccus sp.]|uniref:Hsp70 family protein n=1 Tax=Tessaracoccus sp. TaxID=1971211 RepID=UPI001ED6E712|nr:Hsp70 family protein [Tessaracoccus sp.]MBK7823515.1 Hsp70 family protein [Tessaracoccus sp.]
MSTIFGVDLGTTYTKCARVRPLDGEVEIYAVDHAPGRPDDHLHTLRSAVSLTLDRRGDRIAHVGRGAMAASEAWSDGAPPMRYVEESKLWIGEGLADHDPDAPPWIFDGHGWEYSAEDIGALVLKKMRKVVEARGTVMGEVVITHPQAFNDPRRKATAQAAQLAELVVVDTLTEPNAAALAFLGADPAPGKYMVFDLGGGTLDVTVAEIAADRFTVLGNAGTKRGGRDFDRAIFAWLVDRYREAWPNFEDRFLDDRNTRRWYQIAEDAKVELNDPAVPDKRIQVVCKSRKYDGMKSTHFLTRAEFLDRTQELVDDCLRCADEALRWSGVTWEGLTSIVCVGGSSRLVHVREALAARSGRPLRTDLDPDVAVVQGAALHAHRLATRRASVSLVSSAGIPVPIEVPTESSAGRVGRAVIGNALPNGLGIKAWSASRREWVVANLLAKGTPLPCRVSVADKFVTNQDDVETLDVELWEGERPELKRCNRVGTATLRGIPAGKAGPVVVTVEADVNLERRLIVEAFGKRTEAIIEYDPLMVMSEDELTRRREFLRLVEVV